MNSPLHATAAEAAPALQKTPIRTSTDSQTLRLIKQIVVNTTQATNRTSTRKTGCYAAIAVSRTIVPILVALAAGETAASLRHAHEHAVDA